MDRTRGNRFEPGLGKVQVQKSTKNVQKPRLSSSTKNYNHKRFLKVRVQGRTNLKIILYFAEPCFEFAYRQQGQPFRTNQRRQALQTDTPAPQN